MICIELNHALDQRSFNALMAVKEPQDGFIWTGSPAALYTYYRQGASKLIKRFLLDTAFLYLTFAVLFFIHFLLFFLTYFILRGGVIGSLF